MGQQDAFALGRSNLNGFLFADIGVEGSGMPLSVISALARQGLDPWQEAGRLAELPRTAAADGLAGLIAALPASPWSMPDATAIAVRLVKLLPGQGGGNPLEPLPAFLSRPALPAEARQNPQWLIVPVLTMALLAGLLAYVATAATRSAAAPPNNAAPVGQVPTGD